MRSTVSCDLAELVRPCLSCILPRGSWLVACLLYRLCPVRRGRKIRDLSFSIFRKILSLVSFISYLLRRECQYRRGDRCTAQYEFKSENYHRQQQVPARSGPVINVSCHRNPFMSCKNGDQAFHDQDPEGRRCPYYCRNCKTCLLVSHTR